MSYLCDLLALVAVACVMMGLYLLGLPHMLIGGGVILLILTRMLDSKHAEKPTK